MVKTKEQENKIHLKLISAFEALEKVLSYSVAEIKRQKKEEEFSSFFTMFGENISNAQKMKPMIDECKEQLLTSQKVTIPLLKIDLNATKKKIDRILSVPSGKTAGNNLKEDLAIKRLTNYIWMRCEYREAGESTKGAKIEQDLIESQREIFQDSVDISTIRKNVVGRFNRFVKLRWPEMRSHSHKKNRLSKDILLFEDMIIDFMDSVEEANLNENEKSLLIFEEIEAWATIIYWEDLTENFSGNNKKLDLARAESEYIAKHEYFAQIKQRIREDKENKQINNLQRK